jgi:hypothetical protein
MSSTGVSSSSTEGAVADRFVGGERARFGGRARLAWTVNEERAAGLFIAEQTSDQQSLASHSWLIVIYFRQTSLIIRLRTQLVALTRPYSPSPLANVVHSQAFLRLETVPSPPPNKNTRAVSYPSTVSAGRIPILDHQRSVALDP